MAGREVRAAGAVVLRRDQAGQEVLLVHRPRYDDWSFPKGKCDPDEGFAEAAIREVAEETGLEVVLGQDLGEVRYHDHRDRPKVVRYWAARALGGAFEPNDEVDEVRWVPVGAAPDLLTYPHDADVLARVEPDI